VQAFPRHARLRLPNTGLYANSARPKLLYAEAVFDISYFSENPAPCYKLAHGLYPGEHRLHVTHSYTRLLLQKSLLLKLSIRNIDCLKRESGVPDDSIIEAYGSFSCHMLTTASTMAAIAFVGLPLVCKGTVSFSSALDANGSDCENEGLNTP